MEPFKAGSPSTSERAPVRSQEAEALPAATETWLLAPVVAPEFSLPDLNGTTHFLAALRGNPLLLHFWAANSEDSRRDMAALERVHTAWAGRDLRLIAISIDDVADASAVRAIARDLRLSFPVLLGSEDVAAVYNILFRGLFDRHRDMILPTSFLIDEKGEIVKVYQGGLNLEHVAQDAQSIPRTVPARMAKGLPFPGVTDNTEFGRNYLSWGSVFFQRGYLEQAEASFQTALRDNPSSAEALYGLGSVYLQQQKNNEARRSFERAVQLRAGYPDTLPNAWNNLGLLATREGRTEEAIQHFQEALRLSPDHLVALENLGNAYRVQKRWDNARTTLERAVAVGPDDAEANYSLGMVFAQTSENEQALRYLQKALQVRPDYPEALNNLGILYLRTGKQDAAEASFKESIRVAPAFDQAYLNLARVYAIDGKPEQARSLLQELLKQHPGHAQAQKALAELPQ
jgi:tetratricopeptide (TPR) repeat protein